MRRSIGYAHAATRNTVDVEVEAAVRNTSTVTTTQGGDVILTAKDGSQIDSYAGGAALALAVSQGQGAVTGGFGAAVALNTINNTVRATVDTSTDVTVFKFCIP